MAWSINKGDLFAIMLNLIRADMLCYATSFTGSNIGFPDSI
ncbi:hypothetical protein N752_02455 [Desulforamulus aquiferis]|nr:hypothetical protein N752_02455 [Desulforamulus aquiferis]